MTGPQPEDDHARLAALLLPARWKAAKSAKYEELPHEYTLPWQWASKADFQWCAEAIGRLGYRQFFIGRWWVYLDMADADGTVHQYWAMGGPPATIINRALRRATGTTKEPVAPTPQRRFDFE